MDERIGTIWRGQHDGAGGDAEPPRMRAARESRDIFVRIADLRRRLAVASDHECDALETELAILSALADGGTQRVA
ncbi:hypothetical protein E0K89_015140 [Aquicoccus sp. SCR17]|nr:hypothetical protein [Carideicomes alvinocaridis]